MVTTCPKMVWCCDNERLVFTFTSSNAIGDRRFRAVQKHLGLLLKREVQSHNSVLKRHLRIVVNGRRCNCFFQAPLIVGFIDSNLSRRKQSFVDVEVKKVTTCVDGFDWVTWTFYANNHVLLDLPGLRMWANRVWFGPCLSCHTSPAPTPFRGAWDRTSGSSRTALRCPWWSKVLPCASWSIASVLVPRCGKAERRRNTGWYTDAQLA